MEDMKILINGRGTTLLKDLFTHTDPGFKTLSTSGIWVDILLHMEMFRPDAYICFYGPEDDAMINQMQLLKVDKKFRRIPFIIVGEAASCALFEKKAPNLEVLKIKKPTSAHAIEQETAAYIARQKKYYEEEERKSEEENAAPAKEHSPFSFGSMSFPRPPVPEPDDIDNEDVTAHPREQAQQTDYMAAQAAVVRNSDPNAKKRILIVDDDRTVLKMLKAALGDKYDVSTTINGEMARKHLETHYADLILLDYEMPEESGSMVFKKLKENMDTKFIPVIFLTGITDSERIKQIIMLKPNGYLMKPVNMERLYDLLNKIFGK